MLRRYVSLIFMAALVTPVTTASSFNWPGAEPLTRRCGIPDDSLAISNLIPPSTSTPVATEDRNFEGWGIAYQLVALNYDLETNHAPFVAALSSPNYTCVGYYPIRICSDASCVEPTNATESLSRNIDGAMIRTIQFPIGDYFHRQPVTISVPVDSADPGKGYTKPSNPITGFLDQRDAISRTLGKQAIDFDYAYLGPTSISNVGACFNETAGVPVVEDVDDPERASRFGWSLEGRQLNLGKYYIDLRSYRSAVYTLRENGYVVESGPITSAVVNGQWWTRDGGLCALKGDSNMGIPRAPFAYMNFPEPQDGRNYWLRAGEVYQLTYTLSGESVPELSGSLDFVTPGGCPSSDALAKIPTDPNFVNVPPIDYAILDENQNFVARLPQRSSDFLARYTLAPAVNAGRLAPMYQTWNKTNLGSSTASSWQYVPSMDDWASVVATAQPMTYAKVLERTIFAGCSSSQLSVSISPEPTEDRPAACEAIENLVVPRFTGMCVLKLTVQRVSTTKSGVRKQSTPVAVRVPYSFSSLGKFTIPRSSSAMNVKVSRSVTASSIAKFAKIKVARTSRVTLKVPSGSSKYCKVYRSTLKSLRVGTCKVIVTVAPSKGKSTVKTVSIKISK